jgi:hypothetical protein
MSSPVRKLRDGHLQLTIWRNEGHKGTWYSCFPSRSYKNGDETWCESDSLRRDDLLGMAKLMQDAYTWVGHQQEADRKGRDQADNVTAK